MTQPWRRHPSVMVLPPPPITSMPSLLAEVTVALPKTLTALLDAASRTMLAKVGSFTEVAVPSPMLTVTPLTTGAVLTWVLPAPVQVIESPDCSAACAPLPVTTQAASAGVASHGSAPPAATAPIAVLKRNACRRHVFARRIWGGATNHSRAPANSSFGTVRAEFGPQRWLVPCLAREVPAIVDQRARRCGGKRKTQFFREQCGRGVT